MPTTFTAAFRLVLRFGSTTATKMRLKIEPSLVILGDSQRAVEVERTGSLCTPDFLFGQSGIRTRHNLVAVWARYVSCSLTGEYSPDYAGSTVHLLH